MIKRVNHEKTQPGSAKITLVKKALLGVKALPKYFHLRYFKRAKDVESKIVFVISFPRSGTHAIGSLLSNDSAGFRYYGEFFIFNAWHPQIEKINHFYPFFSFRYALNSRKQRRSWKYNRFETTTLDPIRTLKTLKKLPGIHVIKIFPQHLSTSTLERLIKDFQPSIIFLRRNHLDRFVSHKKANASGKWHTASTSEIEVNLDPKEFSRFIDEYSKFYSHYLEFATSVGCEILDVDFKDLSNSVTVREIQRFAQFKEFTGWDDLVIAPTTVKQDRSSKLQEDFLIKIEKKYEDFDFLKID